MAPTRGNFCGHHTPPHKEIQIAFSLKQTMTMIPQYKIIAEKLPLEKTTLIFCSYPVPETGGFPGKKIHAENRIETRSFA
jgi:hypothetical protein